MEWIRDRSRSAFSSTGISRALKIVSSLAILAEGHVFWIIINSEHMVDIKPDPKSSEETGGLDLLKNDLPDLG